MPYDINIGFGPIWFIWTLINLIILLVCAWIIIDTVRPKRRFVDKTFNSPVEGLTCYAVFAGILTIIGIAAYPIHHLPYFGNLEFIKNWIEFAGVFSRPLMLVLIFVYLKRVVFSPVSRRYNQEVRRQKALEKAGNDSEKENE